MVVHLSLDLHPRNQVMSSRHFLVESTAFHSTFFFCIEIVKCFCHCFHRLEFRTWTISNTGFNVMTGNFSPSMSCPISLWVSTFNDRPLLPENYINFLDAINS